MKYRWQITAPQPLLTAPLAAELGVSPLLAQCLVNRGQETPAGARPFLQSRLKNLADPFLLPGMETAVLRLLRARADQEPLVIFGDYDVDGVTSTALLMEVLSALGWKVHFYLPHRLDEGYGLSREGVENCLQRFPVRLLLAVDCGSTAVETMAWLQTQQVEVIVLDHHQVSSPPPAAVALVNPQLRTEADPDFRELCSAGLAFKLAHALVKRLRAEGDANAQAMDLKAWLDLVALGTIADIVPLVRENRIFTTAGMEQLRATPRPGLIALKEIAQCQELATTRDVGFQLTPRLNASGRLENAEQSLHLLLAESVEVATPLAQALDACNRERQKIEQNISQEVIGAVRAHFNPETDWVIVEGQLLWHIGVVGIVASRCVSEFYRPTFVLGGDGECWRGSGRSVEGFDLAAALRECDDLLLRHGGHAMAAGISIHPDKVPAFRARLNDIARRTLKPEQLQPPLRLDAEIPLAALSLERLDELDRLQPHGPGNPSVQCVVGPVRLQRPPLTMGREKQHLKLWITDGSTLTEAVWWNGAGQPLPTGNFLLACAPQLNAFNGRRNVQLKWLDWKPA